MPGRRYSRRWDTDQRGGRRRDAQFGSDLPNHRRARGLYFGHNTPPPPRFHEVSLCTLGESGPNEMSAALCKILRKQYTRSPLQDSLLLKTVLDSTS